MSSPPRSTRSQQDHRSPPRRTTHPFFPSPADLIHPADAQALPSWAVEDVERQGPLDDLNIHGDTRPPWRAREDHEEDSSSWTVVPPGGGFPTLPSDPIFHVFGNDHGDTDFAAPAANPAAAPGPSRLTTQIAEHRDDQTRSITPLSTLINMIRSQSGSPVNDAIAATSRARRIRVRRRREREEREGLEVDSDGDSFSDNDPPMPWDQPPPETAERERRHITSTFLPLRRRRVGQGVFSQMAYDPDETLPPEAFGAAPMTADDDADMRDPEGRPRRMFGRMMGEEANRSTIDLTAQPGDSTSNLRRGSNNRSRSSLLDRLRDIGPPVERVAGRTRREPSLGLPPTNTVGRSAQPEIVASDDKKRKSPFSPSLEGKKQKVEEKPAPSTPLPTRPSYLQYSTLDKNARIPTWFCRPATSSTLTLEQQSSVAHAPRPKIVFSFGPMPDVRDDKYAGALRATAPIPVECGVHYYECEIISTGERGYMSVGWMKQSADLNRLVGWDKGSWGWHGDDGKTFEQRGDSSDKLGPPWRAGDVIGCGVDFTTGQAFFTRNGTLIGHRFKNLGRNLYPAIGLRTTGEAIAVNFTGPFKYDIDNYARNLRDKIWRDAMRAPTDAIPRLVTLSAQTPSPTMGSESQFSAIKIHESVEQAIAKAQQAVDQDKQEATSSTKEHVAPADTQHSVVPAQFTASEISIEKRLPAQSRLANQQERVHAAFILDYLQHEGHALASRHLANGMRRRQWLPPKADQDSVKTTVPEDPVLSDFESIESAIAHLRKEVLDSHTRALPRRLIRELVTPGRQADTCCGILHFLYLLRQADRLDRELKGQEATATAALPAETSDDIRLQAVSFGRELLESTSPDHAGHALIKEAFGFIGARPETWPTNGVGGAQWREEVGDLLVDDVRSQRGLKNKSHLEQAFAQTVATHRLLAARDHHAAFVDVKRLLTNDTQGKEEGDVKIEPVEAGPRAAEKRSHQ